MRRPSGECVQIYGMKIVTGLNLNFRILFIVPHLSNISCYGVEKILDFYEFSMEFSMKIEIHF